MLEKCPLDNCSSSDYFQIRLIPGKNYDLLGYLSDKVKILLF